MSRMVHVDARDWVCECCVGGDDDCQQYRRFRGSNSALPVYIKHLSSHALLSPYTLKASIFYYQNIRQCRIMWTWRPTLVFYSKIDIFHVPWLLLPDFRNILYHRKE